VNEMRNQGNFEERLLGELKTVVAQRGAEEDAATAAVTPPARRRGPRLAVTSAAVLAAAAAALVFSSGGDNTPAAFAVEPQEGGGETIRIYSPEDAGGLEAALAEAGIRSQVDWLPAGKTCQDSRFVPSTAQTAAGGSIGGMTLAGPGKAMTLGLMSAQQWEERARQHASGEISTEEYDRTTANVTLDPASLRPDQTVVIFGSRGPYLGDPEGGFEAQMAIAEGPVAPCNPVAVPAGRTLSEMNAVVEAEAAAGR
jgi:hypothetical protein